jgi:SAM-dependent methyltransferase
VDRLRQRIDGGDHARSIDRVWRSGAWILSSRVWRSREWSHCWREGWDAYGCDVVLEEETERQRLIQMEPYRIPYPDDFFDVAVSNQVFEHVQNPEEAFAELERVLKPDGVGLHVFPGRYRIKEGHTFVPFGSVLRARWWLRLWAMLGVRNSFQHGLSAKEVARRNREFLTAQTRYLRRREIRRCAPRVEFVELRHLEMVRPWPHWVLRPLAPVYSALRTRMILTRTP